jgi:hypothetical protein
MQLMAATTMLHQKDREWACVWQAANSTLFEDLCRYPGGIPRRRDISSPTVLFNAVALHVQGSSFVPATQMLQQRQAPRWVRDAAGSTSPEWFTIFGISNRTLPTHAQRRRLCQVHFGCILELSAHDGHAPPSTLARPPYSLPLPITPLDASHDPHLPPPFLSWRLHGLGVLAAVGMFVFYWRQHAVASYLLSIYDCYLNVEIFASREAVRYLYKYIYKESDCANVQLRHIQSGDEVSMYEDMHYFGASESMWRLLELKLFFSRPNMERLPVHLDDEVNVLSRQGNECRVSEHVLSSPSHILPTFPRMPALPDELLRMIWLLKWGDEAAQRIQRSRQVWHIRRRWKYIRYIWKYMTKCPDLLHYKGHLTLHVSEEHQFM